VAWSQTQPRTTEFRQEYLRRLAELLHGQWSRWVSFVQQNQPALRDHTEAGQKMQSRLLLLCAPIIEPEAVLQDQLRSLLGLLAVYLGNLAPASAMLRLLGFEGYVRGTSSGSHGRRPRARGGADFPTVLTAARRASGKCAAGKIISTSTRPTGRNECRSLRSAPHEDCRRVSRAGSRKDRFPRLALAYPPHGPCLGRRSSPTLG